MTNTISRSTSTTSPGLISGSGKRLITQESDLNQYRFQDIIDPDNGKVVFTIEHEVRSMRHPLYLRPLVNRNPAQNIMRYEPGSDAQNWATVSAS